MNTPADRLQWARRKRGYQRPADAAKAFGWNVNTYKSHENGLRGLRQTTAARYGRAFHVPAGWLLTGEGDVKDHLTDREAHLLGSFRALAETDQHTVIRICEGLSHRAELVPAPTQRTGTRG